MVGISHTVLLSSQCTHRVLAMDRAHGRTEQRPLVVVVLLFLPSKQYNTANMGNIRLCCITCFIVTLSGTCTCIWGNKAPGIKPSSWANSAIYGIKHMILRLYIVDFYLHGSCQCCHPDCPMCLEGMNPQHCLLPCLGHLR